MLHRFSHYNSRLLRTWTSIMILLIWTIGGVSAFAKSTLSCGAGCCCGMSQPALNNYDGIVLQKKAGACCHGSNTSGPMVSSCRIPLSLAGASQNALLVSRSHSDPEATAAISPNITLASIAPPAFRQEADNCFHLSTIPIYLQKQTFLC